MKKKQLGFIPIPILIALGLAAVIGGVIGYNLGDGTFFSFGLGVGLSIVAGSFLLPFFEKFRDYLRR